MTRAKLSSRARGSRLRQFGAVAAVAAVVVLAGSATGAGASASATTSGAGPDLPRAVAYLVDPARLVSGHYYQGPAGPGFADFSLTLDGAFALAATGQDAGALAAISQFLGSGGTDATGRSIDAWTGIGTPFASGASIAKQALLAEVMGADPHGFGGHDLVAALAATVCTQVSVGPDTSCPAVGTYRYSPSVFAQGLGIIAALRAGSGAAAPVAYLEGHQHPDGSWPSLIPDSADADVDSTAMAVMALSLVSGPRAASAVARGLAWVATRQASDGGFVGAAGDSTNSAALAAQALHLAPAAYQTQLVHVRAFLARQQNPDGGFIVAVGGPATSDLRASTQAVGGAVGTSFAVLVALARPPSTTPSPSPSPSVTVSGSVSASASATGGSATATPRGSVDPSASVSAAALAAAGNLPATGAPLGWSVSAGAVLVLAGLALLVAGRRPAASRRH